MEGGLGAAEGAAGGDEGGFWLWDADFDDSARRGVGRGGCLRVEFGGSEEGEEREGGGQEGGLGERGGEAFICFHI